MRDRKLSGKQAVDTGEKNTLSFLLLFLQGEEKLEAPVSIRLAFHWDDKQRRGGGGGGIELDGRRWGCFNWKAVRANECVHPNGHEHGPLSHVKQSGDRQTREQIEESKSKKHWTDNKRAEQADTNKERGQ